MKNRCCPVDFVSSVARARDGPSIIRKSAVGFTRAIHLALQLIFRSSLSLSLSLTLSHSRVPSLAALKVTD